MKKTKKNSLPKLKIKKNDIVQVLAGNDKGKTGKVLAVFPQKMRVVVEGVNIHKHHLRPTQQNPEGQILEREDPIHYSNVMVLDGNNKPTRIGKKIMEEDGKKTWSRIARTTGEDL